MVATLIAEALAAAERETPCETRGACRYAALPTEHLESEACDGEFDDVGWMGSHTLARDNVGTVPMVRLDVMDAALRHLAERAAKAEARSAKLRAAIVRGLDQRNKLSAVPYSIAIEALDEDNKAAKAAPRD